MQAKSTAYSLRIEPGLLKRIDKVEERYLTLKHVPGFGAGLPPVLGRAQVIRWALQEGLAAIEKALEAAEAAKTGRSR